MSILIYTDGSCNTSTKDGGWASAILWESKKKILYGYESNTTSNRMEMLAVIRALEFLSPINSPQSIKIFSDSRIVTKTTRPRKNLDLWAEIGRLTKNHTIELHWVKGHDTNYWNNYCDRLAVRARKSGGNRFHWEK